jgi:septum site-determining protein MinC
MQAAKSAGIQVTRAMNVAAFPKKTFRLRGRSFFTMVLSPEPPFSAWLAEVDERIARTPDFFAGKPLVLDVAGLDASRIELTTLVSELAERGVRILGIEGADADSLGLGLPPALAGGRNAGDLDFPGAVAKRRASILIDEPVRSGQNICNPDGDVIVVGSVSSGAEIVAAGSIHVYGALRGRAFAGTSGDQGARIFCRRLEAELIAIDGFYKLADEIDPKLHRKAMQAWLQGEAVMMETLD